MSNTEDLENKLTSLLKEVKEIVELLDKKGYQVIITPPFKDYENTYKMELNISKPIHI